ncbi:putative disease resistance protein [Citrus sinensis]|uniref:Disease resistance protein n=1 Tax=Citrus sinensis TaxID=2711 RepID=A0ACB8NXQ7_CITSI|nr:putative disease resistance protein [Citrus sinensis]
MESELLGCRHLTAPNPKGLVIVETGGPVFVGYASTKTSSDEQTSDNRVPRAGISYKSLVSGGAGAGISCSSTSTSSTRPISCWKHRAIPASFLLRVESRRPGQRQLARRALQSENQGTKATQPPTTAEMGHPISRGGRITSANGGKARVQKWPIKREGNQNLASTGFIPDNSEATAGKYVEQLINRGFVDARKRRAGGTINTCSIRGRCRPVLLAMAFKAEFIFFSFMDPEGKSRKNVKSINIFEKQSDFACLDDYDSHMHSLLYFTSKRDHLDPIDWEKICRMFKLLRVLDLGSLVLIQYPSGIENLFLLRYLKLNIPSLKILPSSLLSNLLNLYTLDMLFSYIDHTTDEFWKMNKLRHLNFGSITLPAHPGKYCGSLENLNFISALHPCCCTEDILGRLPNLRNLRIRGDLSYYQFLLSQNICRLSCLESLKLVNESKMPRISKIILAEYLFPHSLTHLSFSNTNLMDDPMSTLEKLPLLQVLKLKQNSYSGRKLTCGSYGFPNLKVLHLKSMLWLEEWTMGTGAMPKLECLLINPCAYLKRVPEQL